MTDLDTASGSVRLDYERALMRSPLAAQLCVVQHRIEGMMAEQKAVHPRDLVASAALLSSGYPTLSSA